MKDTYHRALLSFILALSVLAGSGFGALRASAGEDVQLEKQVEEWVNSLRLAEPVEAAGPGNPSQSNAAAANLTGDELNAYADRIFELVNRERESAGAAPLERSGFLDEAANTRATECASVNSIRVDGKAHTHPDGSRWFTVLGIDENKNYGEIVGQGGATADARMKSFMNSEGHKACILRDAYTETGIGCAVSEQGEIFVVQIFYRP